MMKSCASILVLLALAGGVAQAVPTYVGSYAVYDGPWWVDNPPVYSAREAAALIFGGLPTDYLISINPSQDYTTITLTGWYDGWGEHQGMIFDQDYKLDTGNPGYNDPEYIEGAARSAYVKDGLFDTAKFRNYVWLNDAAPAVPAPGALLLVTLGAAGVTWIRRRRML
jgi:hypothetical protein